jgi:hypothetical protein
MGNRLLLIFFIFASPATSLYAEEMQHYITPHITITYEPQIENAALKIADAYPEVKEAVESRFGWQLKSRPTVVLLSSGRTFRNMSRNSLVTAFAVSRKNLIVIDYTKMDRTPVDLRATFEHELYHLLLHYHISRADLPKWLDEGVAQWASGGVADIINPGNKDILKQSVLSDTLLPLREISATFPAQPRKFILAYQQSKSFLEFIVSEYGEDTVRSVLHSLKQGEDIESAIAKNLATDLYELEQAWKKQMLRKYSWFTYFADHIYWILFSAAALITLLGYLRFRIRLKNYRDTEDEGLFDHENNS